MGTSATMITYSGPPDQRFRVALDGQMQPAIYTAEEAVEHIARHAGVEMPDADGLEREVADLRKQLAAAEPEPAEPEFAEPQSLTLQAVSDAWNIVADALESNDPTIEAAAETVWRAAFAYVNPQQRDVDEAAGTRPAEPAPRFAVGDRVRVRGKTWHNETGTVKRLWRRRTCLGREHWYFAYFVERDTGGELGFRENELEPAGPTPEEKEHE